MFTWRGALPPARGSESQSPRLFSLPPQPWSECQVFPRDQPGDLLCSGVHHLTALAIGVLGVTSQPCVDVPLDLINYMRFTTTCEGRKGISACFLENTWASVLPPPSLESSLNHLTTSTFPWWVYRSCSSGGAGPGILPSLPALLTSGQVVPSHGRLSAGLVK